MYFIKNIKSLLCKNNILKIQTQKINFWTEYILCSFLFLLLCYVLASLFVNANMTWCMCGDLGWRGSLNYGDASMWSHSLSHFVFPDHEHFCYGFPKVQIINLSIYQLKHRKMIHTAINLNTFEESIWASNCNVRWAKHFIRRSRHSRGAELRSAEHFQHVTLNAHRLQFYDS